MLIGVPSALSPDLLRHLQAMGHGDEIVIADANFPAEACARRIERLPGVSSTDAVRAVLTLMPLDTYIDAPARTMEVVGDPGATPEIVTEFERIIREVADPSAGVASIERHAFYEEAKGAYCIVQTSERRLYGNIILSKGVVLPD